jgi:hypothetical protein
MIRLVCVMTRSPDTVIVSLSLVIASSVACWSRCTTTLKCAQNQTTPLGGCAVPSITLPSLNHTANRCAARQDLRNRLNDALSHSLFSLSHIVGELRKQARRVFIQAVVAADRRRAPMV